MNAALVSRCPWSGDDPLYTAYHDDEWGVPVHDDRRLFEVLTLEGAQAGLSWITILRKREGYRRAFVGFDPKRVARFSDRDIARLMEDASIVRNRAKIASTINNAGRVLEIQREFGSLDAFLWRGNKTVVNDWRDTSQIPPSTPESKALSKELKRRGFSFVGPTTMYAFMQACGFVDDHIATCFRRTAKRP